tara:strand:+ start:589 stop:810 length:222 start_codon:yes stop_codon:yes gene_type:complete
MTKKLTKILLTPEYPNGKEVNLTTDEINKINFDVENDNIDEIITQIKQKKASGKQKLKDLGLDDDEIKALLGA